MTVFIVSLLQELRKKSTEENPPDSAIRSLLVGLEREVSVGGWVRDWHWSQITMG